MKKRLSEYLDKKGARAVEPVVLERYATAMKNNTVPKIVEDVRENEERAAELRVSPSAARRRGRNR